jgi:very-short-patch-repair endonuclease
VKYITDSEYRTKKGNLRYLDDLRMLAKNNRNNQTDAEKLFWMRLRKYNYAFLRQKPLRRFIVDFYCSKLLLVIEIDGGYHAKRKNYDDGRDEIFRMMGIMTIRFSNDRVVRELDNVFRELDEITHEREKKLGFKVPLSSKRDLG